MIRNKHRNNELSNFFVLSPITHPHTQKKVDQESETTVYCKKKDPDVKRKKEFESPECHHFDRFN